MNDWQVVLPHICPRENLAGCLASMGKITVPLLLVDNSPDSHTRQMNLPDSIEVVYYPQNLGVAASWNLGLKRGARWTMICSASMRFEADGLGSLIERASAAANGYGLIIYSELPASQTTVIHWHLRVIGRATVDTIGDFDENFYPARFEDNDYKWRMALAGIAQVDTVHPRKPERIVPWLQTRVICVGEGLSFRCMDQERYDFNFSTRYFIEKWGSTSPYKQWEHPFNDETKGLDWWPKT